MIATLWPYYNRAIRNIVDETVTASLAQVCEQVSKSCRTGCLCWITHALDVATPKGAKRNLGWNVLKSKSLDSIEIEHMDLGKKPLQIGGIKTYETRDDEVIIEAPILWGSDARVRGLIWSTCMIINGFVSASCTLCLGRVATCGFWSPINVPPPWNTAVWTATRLHADDLKTRTAGT